MELFWIKFLGLYYLAIALVWLIRREDFLVNMQSFTKSTSSMILAGIMALMLGIAITLTTNVWDASPRTLITIIGYLAIAKGFYLIAAPHSASEFYTRFLKGTYSTILLIIVIGLGGILTYLGFY